MRYINVDINNITEIIRVPDIRFKTYIEDTINIKPRQNNLKDMNNLKHVLDYVDTLSSSTDSTDSTNELSLDKTINSINSRIKSYEAGPKLNHVFAHNMQTEYFSYSIWVYQNNNWINNIVPIRIIDQDTVEVVLSEELSCRIILTNINDVTKTYNI